MTKEAFFDIWNKEMSAAYLAHLDLYAPPRLWCQPKAPMLSEKIQTALNALSAACAEQGLKLDSVDIKKSPIKPYTTEYSLYTPGGVVKVKREV